jgi:Phage portal protein, SPP1 Gp6-like.
LIFDKVKQFVIKYFKKLPAQNKQVNIREELTLEGEILKNKTWYKGNVYELDQFFKQTITNNVTGARFWSANCSDGMDIRKIHSGLPALIVDTLTNIVVSDLDGIETNSDQLNYRWEEIANDNDFKSLLTKAVSETLITGDGAFKISLDTNITSCPIIEFYGADKVEYSYKRGRLQEIHFFTEFKQDNKIYTLMENYGKGYISYTLFDETGNAQPLTMCEETAELEGKNVTFTGDYILGVPLKFFESTEILGRGKSIFSNKTDDFDALDEIVSQWLEAVRNGRINKYIPEDLVPRDEMGSLMKPNSFDNKFIVTGASLSENGASEIQMTQADIKYQAYVESYAAMLDLSIQGIISPATLGIDLKKTDNAESQREKEKVTLYTRGKMVSKLSKALSSLVATCLSIDGLTSGQIVECEVSAQFGEYNAPDFNSIVETVGTAKNYGIMSIEKAIDELYGDTMTDEEKQEEIDRIKEQNSIGTFDEMSVVGQDGFEEREEVEEEE